ncbi:MAG: carboxylesterase/lipase family protein [Oscillospiraceae bacterium]|nr:carboxylesterase/lipase family protein [Oscillospiraceae bacterium]
MIKDGAIINTKEGKLEGVCIDGIYRFIGVRYAEPTWGENRFMPPQPLKPWEGVRPAKEYAPICWQTDTPRMEDKEVTSTDIPSLYGKLLTGNTDPSACEQSEDCLAVNIWTAGLRDGRKRPVMVWFHGGGYIAGGAPCNWHDGWNMAKKQDVVLVSVGHRLGIFGYLYLGLFDERYKDSANVGHQDMAAALRWIKENAEELGGDPDNITIFGQSGGGGKVAGLMAMPLAKGCVHKAIIQSGGFGGLVTKEKGAEVAKQLLDHLGIAPENAKELLKYSAEELIEATREINRTRTNGNYFVCPLIKDGEVIKYDPFDGAEGSEYSKDVILMSGYTRDDAKLQALFNPPVFSYTMEELPDRLMELGYSEEDSDKIIRMYEKVLPEDHDACDIYTGLLQDRNALIANINRYEAREKVGASPMYNYVFCREAPSRMMKAIHGVEVPFVFDNAVYAPEMWNADTRVTAMQVSEATGAAWAAFARTGNPSNPYMPAWKPYDSVNRYTMSIDVECRLISDYRKEIREFLGR